MAKPRTSVRFTLPAYKYPRRTWRKAIHQHAAQAVKERNLRYTSDDYFELIVRIYLTNTAAELHDVDNRLKDIMDALQGRISGPKGNPPWRPIIPNDKQIWRVLVEKDDSARHKGHAGAVSIRRWRRKPL